MKIVIPGNPISKIRARTVRIKGKVRTYDPQDVEKKMVAAFLTKCVREAFDEKDKKMQMKASGLACGDAFYLTLSFYLTIPKSDSLAKKNAKLWRLEMPVSKPDCDNYIKFYLDCANGILYPDDSMVISIQAKKYYSKNPRTEIEIMPIKRPRIHPKLEQVLHTIDPDTIQEMSDEIFNVNALCNYMKQDTPLQTDFEELAKSLIQFSCKYSAYFQKIKKFSDVLDEMKHIQEKKESYAI